MARLGKRDVVRLEGEIAAQVYRNPRDEELPEGKHLIAVQPGSVTVGMIYDGARFTRPPHKTSPVVVVKEAIENSAIAPFSIPPPLPPQARSPQQLESPQSNSMVVNVHRDGEVSARQPHEPPHQNGALSGKSVQSGSQGGEPAASAAPHPLTANVADTSRSYEGSVNSGGFSGNHQQDAALKGELQHPVININTSIDEVKRDAAEYIERQARGVLAAIPQHKEVVRQAIAETVIQAEAMLVKCTNHEQIKNCVEAFALAVRGYVEGSNTGNY